jgi:hypothetical protein
VLVGIVLFSAANMALAKGQGAVAVWAASERFALVTDTSLPGLVLVDLQTGVARERLVMDSIRPVGVASCSACDFILVSSGKSNIGNSSSVKSQYRLLRLSGTVESLLAEKGSLDLASARSERLQLETADGEKPADGRMLLVSNDGKAAFIASSLDRAVFRVDFEKSPNTVKILQDNKAKPFGLNWDRNGQILVSMHKQAVWRMTADGEVLSIYQIKSAECPGALELKPNLRAAVDDPYNKDSVLILASNPISYDAVVWRLTVDAQGRQSCANVAGMIGRDSGWIDAVGEAIEFSRPHHFALRPEADPAQLVITDIDNRALRLLDLQTNATTTLMYDRDRLVSAMAPAVRTSRLSCSELQWPVNPGSAGSTTGEFCLRPASAGDSSVTLEAAESQCRAAGARLCEPAELTLAGAPAAERTWTRAACASCWQRKAREECQFEEAYKSPDAVHSHPEFMHSWRSGQALAVVSADTGDLVIRCEPFDTREGAAATCCANAPVNEPVEDA